MPTRPLSVLTVAGSDSGGGAGIAADLRVFNAHGLHGLAAITAVTAQNTQAVSAVHALPAPMVAAQIEALRTDFRIAAIKTGMLANRAIVACVIDEFGHLADVPLVVDPVLRAGTGHGLLDPRAMALLRRGLFPLATLVTPNLPELAVLSGLPVDTPAQIDAAARALLADGMAALLVKGGHGPGGQLIDRLYLADGTTQRFRHPRLKLRTHGTGCTLASAIAARLAQGTSMVDAVALGIGLVQGALARRFRPARGDTCLLMP